MPFALDTEGAPATVLDFNADVLLYTQRLVTCE